MTRINLLLPSCLSLTSRLCHPPRPSIIHTASQKATHTWSPQHCGRQGRARVWRRDRFGCVSGVPLHTCARLTAASTPDPLDGEGHDHSCYTHHTLHDPDSPPPWQDKEHLKETEEGGFLEFASRSLQNLFGLSPKEAHGVLMRCFSRRITEATVLHNLRSLHQCGVLGRQIQRIPWILSFQSEELSAKLVLIKGAYLFREHYEGLGFCYLPYKMMTTYQRCFKNEAPMFPNHPNRIYYLAERIQVPVELFTERIGKPHRTLAMDLRRLDAMIDLFHEHGMSPEDIIADLWVFGYTLEKAQVRLHKVAELGCTEIKPWMCRCSDKIFDRFCERYISGKELLGQHESLFSYLAERLDCDLNFLVKAFESNKVLKKVHIAKFSKILDLLYAEGISAKEITACMRVFQYSEERTAARIKELKKAGFFPFPMSILCRTPGRFKGMVSQHKKRRKWEIEE